MIAVDIRSVAARHPLVLVVVGVLLYSVGPVLIQASDTTGPVFSFWRLWMGVVIFGFLLLVHRARGGEVGRTGMRLALVGGVWFGANQLLLMSAIKATTVADVMLMTTLSPIFVAILAVPMFGERPGWMFRIWSVVSMAGAGAVAVSGSTGPRGDPAGMAMAFGGMLAYVFFFMVSKRGRDYLDVVPFLFGVTLVAALSVTAFDLAVGEPIMTMTSRDLALVTLMALGPGALGHFVMTWPLNYISANVPPILRLATPFLAAALAWYFIGEPFTWVHLLGGLAVVVGAGGAVLSLRPRESGPEDVAEVSATQEL